METHFDALTALRILCGIWFLPHIVGKLRNMERAAPTFEKVGLRPGRLFVYLTVALEVLAGIAWWLAFSKRSPPHWRCWFWRERVTPS
jgi:putative oxidoreductase